MLGKPGRDADLVGIGGGQKRYMALTLSDLINGPHVLFVRRGDPQGGPSPGLMVEVLAADADRASALLDELRELMRDHDVFRGQMISLESTMWGQVNVAFHERPTTRRNEVILPDEVLAAIERQTLGIARRADDLRAPAGTSSGGSCYTAHPEPG